MKKILSLVLALLMMLGCAALAEDLTGAWYGDLFGIPVTMTLNADGTYGMEVMGETQPGVWVMEGETLYMDKGTDMETILAYDAAAETLTMDMDGMVCVFGREAAAAFVPAEPKTDAAIEEFAGQWEAANVYFMDMLVPTDFAEMRMTLKIENTSIDAAIDLMGDVETFVAEGVVSLNKDGLSCGDVTIPVSDILDLSIHGKRGVVFSTAREYYELIPREDACAVKFAHLFWEHKNRLKG